MVTYLLELALDELHHLGGDCVGLDEHIGHVEAGGEVALHAGDLLRLLEAVLAVEVLQEIEQRALLALELDLRRVSVLDQSVGVYVYEEPIYVASS
jgi:hypothetical protein